MKVAQVAREYCVRQRITVCNGDDKRVEQDAGNWDKAVDIIPPTNWWADRENEPGTGIVPKVLCWS